MNSLKELYNNYFSIGVACESIHDNFTNNEIGNPDKEALMLQEFNSMTFANELKPAYNMGWNSPEATEEYLPFVINPNAKLMLDFARKNNIKIRGHVLVWHSQCANEAFCVGYKPVTIPTDPEILKQRPFMKRFEKLDPVCFVDRDTMLKRLNSYIRSCMEYMYKNGYADVIYAWDVVNEAIELMDKQPTGLRNSYWYRVIGDDFIYWAFRFAKDAVDDYSVKYAKNYGVSPDSHLELKKIKPLLFYNDYNEFHPDKKEAIIAALERRTAEHGSILGEGLIDGIGMQGHLSDNNNINEYITALKDYSRLVDVVHITELDVKCTCMNINKYYYQAVFYKKLFEALVKANNEGARLKCVTFWGLTDDNSWIRGADPLLFNADLSPKKSYLALKCALTGESLGEPEKIQINLSDRFIDFEPKGDEPQKLEDYGFKTRGFAHIAFQNKFVHSGTTAISQEIRFDEWSSISFDISDFIGQTIEVSAWVKSPAKKACIRADVEGFPIVAEAECKPDEFVEVKGIYTVPDDIHSMFLYFSTLEETEGKFSALYIDDVSIKLIGLVEGFEGRKNIAAVRGVGHLPMLMVTDKESRTEGGHSLQVTRAEKEATVKFNISSYIGHKVNISAFVKTDDSTIYLGIDGSKEGRLSEVASNKDGWTYISAEAVIPDDAQSAEFFIETDGNSDYYVDDILVTRC
ncbi:MAG: endo-1,4-beta-xylanase [Lachnospiraceae bacterium]|nr:endo-1,4-beta-xylanase [Lachnospiraceae bacterium]